MGPDLSFMFHVHCNSVTVPVYTDFIFRTGKINSEERSRNRKENKRRNKRRSRKGKIWKGTMKEKTLKTKRRKMLA